MLGWPGLYFTLWRGTLKISTGSSYGRVAAGLVLATTLLAAPVRGQITCNQSITGCFDVTLTTATTPTPLAGFARSEGHSVAQIWYAHLIVPGGSSSLYVVFKGATRPGTGTYDIVNQKRNMEPPPGSFTATATLDPTLPLPSALASVSGTITITESDVDWVGGTFRFTAGASNGAPGAQVDVVGSFRAQNTEM